VIGAWSTFGVGDLPNDGEAVVFIEYGFCLEDCLQYSHNLRATVAVYKYGSLHLQDGGIVPVPYGCEWTALPHPKVKA
jgi:hypothetical protein